MEIVEQKLWKIIQGKNNDDTFYFFIKTNEVAGENECKHVCEGKIPCSIVYVTEGIPSGHVCLDCILEAARKIGIELSSE
jgi:hypothetical protein